MASRVRGSSLAASSSTRSRPALATAAATHGSGAPAPTGVWGGGITALAPGSGSARALVASLTARQREVLGLLADGLCNRVVAERLVIAETTAKRHVENLLHKLSAPNRAAAVAVFYAARDGGSRPDGDEDRA